MAAEVSHDMKLKIVVRCKSCGNKGKLEQSFVRQDGNTFPRPDRVGSWMSEYWFCPCNLHSCVAYDRGDESTISIGLNAEVVET